MCRRCDTVQWQGDIRKLEKSETSKRRKPRKGKWWAILDSNQ